MGALWITGIRFGDGQWYFSKQAYRKKKVYAEAVEKNSEYAAQCIELGLTAYQGDILDGLDQYGEQSFDYALLLGTFQELLSPEVVLRDAFRVAKYVMIAFTNFAHWGARCQLMFSGTIPSLGESKKLPWYENPNIQFFSGIDFRSFCKAKKIDRVRSAYFKSLSSVRFLPNLRSQEILSLLRWKNSST